MADKLQGNGHKTETPDVSHIRNVEVTHEKSDVSVRGVLMFVVALTIAGIAIHVGIWLLFRYFNAQDARAPKPGPMALSGEARLPQGPRLQAAPGFEVTLEDGQKVKLEKREPQAEYRVLRRQWDENLRTGLKDQSGKVVGMPIDAAIDKVLSGGGLPSRPKGPTGIDLPTAWSSGRESDKRVQ